jgi:Type VI secretion system/phage-baseplate injector OB domain/Gp5 C-terminal repeat (3 copies)
MSTNSVNDRLEEATEDGKYEGYVIGTVTENNDPKGIARIQIKIANVLDTDQGPVPWCLPSKHSPFGQGSGYGVYGSPAVGSPVRITFQNGDPHYPVYEADEYLTAHANPKFKDPKTWGFKDPGGSELFVNYDTGAWEFTHQSGLSLKYDGDGNLTQYIPGDQTETIDGDQTETVGGDSNITIKGALVINVTTDITISAGGNIKLDSPGVTTTGNMSVGTGATATFGTTTGQTVTVVDGIIIDVS